MRIVAGKHRGREIEAPPGNDVRPTSDRAREALFNILEHGLFAANGSPIVGKRVLDAFAGTGAFGLEALSRGAAQANFMELAPAALKALNANIARLKEEPNCRVLAIDATRPPMAPRDCSLAFLDPPYGSGLAAQALPALAENGWLLPGALAVVEVAAREPFDAPPEFSIEDERSYGAARLIFLRRASSRRVR
jgi:16S rRNA (guanine966-N2)-methyltransferase